MKSLPLSLLVLSLLSATTIVTVSIFVPPIYAEFKFEDSYTNHDGNTITADEYKQRMIYCWNMGSKGLISLEESEYDCRSWVLSKEGESMIADYIFEKALN